MLCFDSIEPMGCVHVDHVALSTNRNVTFQQKAASRDPPIHRFLCFRVALLLFGTIEKRRENPVKRCVDIYPKGNIFLKVERLLFVKFKHSAVDVYLLIPSSVRRASWTAIAQHSLAWPAFACPPLPACLVPDKLSWSASLTVKTAIEQEQSQEVSHLCDPWLQLTSQRPSVVLTRPPHHSPPETCN